MSQTPTIPAKVTESGEFRTLECGLFADYYRALQLQTGQIVPTRKAFSPASARSFLPYVSIMEIKEPRLALIRLVGTAIVNRTRIENTGQNMLDFLPEATRDRSWTHFRRLLDTPCGCTFRSQEDYAQTSMVIEILSYPFSDQRDMPTYIISLSIEVDRQSLILRGEKAMQISELHDFRYIDIGCGV